MELKNAIQDRHSVRAYKKDPVSSEILLQLADAGQQAPTTSNMQAWRFLFVTDPELKAKVDLFAQGLSGKPPVILVICSDMEVALKKGGKNAEIYGCMIDAALAAENIMLTAVEYGLGTCLIKSYEEDAVREILRIPEKYRIEMLMSIGYPEGEARCPKRPDVEQVAFFDRMPEADADIGEVVPVSEDDLLHSDGLKEGLVAAELAENALNFRKKVSPERDLLIYMLTSAKALPNEPSAYGLLRLVESVKRICEIWLEKEPENKIYQELLKCIYTSENKQDAVKKAIQLLMK